MMDWLSNLTENRMFFRRVVLLSAVALTGWAVWEAYEFARESRFDGVGTAAVVAAILVPINGLTGYVFSWYSQARIDKAQRQPRVTP